MAGNGFTAREDLPWRESLAGPGGSAGAGGAPKARAAKVTDRGSDSGDALRRLIAPGGADDRERFGVPAGACALEDSPAARRES